jgi:hypothetical protein
MIFLIAWNLQGLESDSLLGQAAASFLSLAASGRYVASRPWVVVAAECWDLSTKTWGFQSKNMVISSDFVKI